MNGCFNRSNLTVIWLQVSKCQSGRTNSKIDLIHGFTALEIQQISKPTYIRPPLRDLWCLLEICMRLLQNSHQHRRFALILCFPTRIPISIPRFRSACSIAPDTSTEMEVLNEEQQQARDLSQRRLRNLIQEETPMTPRPRSRSPPLPAIPVAPRPRVGRRFSLCVYFAIFFFTIAFIVALFLIDGILDKFKSIQESTTHSVTATVTFLGTFWSTITTHLSSSYETSKELLHVSNAYICYTPLTTLIAGWLGNPWPGFGPTPIQINSTFEEAASSLTQVSTVSVELMPFLDKFHKAPRSLGALIISLHDYQPTMSDKRQELITHLGVKQQLYGDAYVQCQYISMKASGLLGFVMAYWSDMLPAYERLKELEMQDNMWWLL